ncbi:putative membrane spanning protein [Qipengyuania citrea LAMA 915]|uniref:Putative membrane spanning protein n=1 Tax=Qipengyuania citrea LAMA 915 TaxID=1306953 RepID=A0A0L1KH02_9SPHN|nr:DUF3987 domain-containing protein [Qipengyuania citrea]KNH03087.1 putative membrane spanning protein [Qipengyuania citrea LAMA 915]
MTAATMKDAFSRAEVVSIWPKLDRTLVNNGRRPAVDMPPHLFGAVWDVILQVADATATKPDYAAIAYLTAAASLIGGKRRASPYGLDWSEPCILWCAALGDPSSRKSAPLDHMTKPLWALQDAAKEEHDERKREYAAEVERAKVERIAWQDEVKQLAGSPGGTPPMPTIAVEPEPPRERRTVISDATPEAVADVLVGNPQGVLCYNDELAGWLESFDRYTSGGRPFWLSAYGGRPHAITRKGAGTIHIPFNGVSVLGSIQPDKVVDHLDGANDGLVPRILWAWPDKLPPRPQTVRVDRTALEAAYSRLDHLGWGEDEAGNPCAKVLRLDDDARDVFSEWEISNAANDGEGSSLFASFAGKLGGLVLRLALVAELTDWAFNGGGEPATISLRSLSAAIAFCEDYAKPMAQRVYGDAAVSSEDRNASLLARYIVKNGFRTVNMRELRQHPHKGHLKPLQAKGAMDAAFEVAQDAGWIRPAFSRDGDTVGQPRKDYDVNPAALGGAA